MNKTWDAKTDARIATLHPLLSDLVTKGINECAAIGIYVRVVEANRSFERSDALYAQPWDKIDNDHDGRIDEADEKVTNAKGGDSFHNYKLAFDFVEIKPCYGYSPAYDARRWDDIITIFTRLGFKSGKRWNDRPHMQMTFGKSLKQIKEMYVEQGKPQYLKF